jgi:DNA-binding GntR family transcriptional regulator
MEKPIGPKLIEWVEMLNRAGATTVDDGGNPNCHPVVRSLIAAMHIALAGEKNTEMFDELESAFKSAMAEAGEMLKDSGPVPLLP